MKKRLFAFVAATIGIFAFAITFAVNGIGRKAEIRQVRATVPTGTRRVWIIDNNSNDPSCSGSSWWTLDKLVLHVWTEGLDAQAIDVKAAHKVVNDLYWGFWYVDIEMPNATSEIKVIAGMDTESTGKINWGNNNQTGTQTLPAFGTAGDILWLNAGTYHDGTRYSRNASVGVTNGLNAGQLAAVLALYNTCYSGNTYGYNAYPQLNKNILERCGKEVLESEQTLADYDYQEYIDAGKDYSKINKDKTSTIKDKIAGLKYWYEYNNA